MALLFGCALLPLPGVHQLAAMAQASRAGAWWGDVVGGWPPAYSLLSGGLLGLVLARALLGLLVERRASEAVRRTWAAAVASLYVAGSALSGAAMGLTLSDRYPDLTTAPPAVVAGLDAAAMAVTAILLWVLCDLVRRSGLGSGALLLFGAWEGVQITRYVVSLLGAAWAGEPELELHALHTGALPVALVLVALWRWEPAPYPVHVARSLWIRGPLDLVVLPLVAGAVAGTVANDVLGFPSWAPHPPTHDPGLLARSLGSLLVVPALGWWIRRQPGHPGAPAWLVAALVLLGGTGGLLLAVVLS